VKHWRKEGRDRNVTAIHIKEYIVRNSRKLQNVYIWIFSPCQQTNLHVSSRIQTWWSTAELTSSATQFTRVLYAIEVKVEIKPSLYRPGQEALRVPWGWGSQISRQLALEGGKVVSPTHWPSLPPRKYSRYSFLLQAESIPGPLCSRKDYVNAKSQMTPSGIECATFRHVAQCLNQLRHRDTSFIKQFLQQNTHTIQMLALLRTQSTSTHTLYDVLNM
jgi:hypothetical protein